VTWSNLNFLIWNTQTLRNSKSSSGIAVVSPSYSLYTNTTAASQSHESQPIAIGS
jgi:hypothetical protein